MHAPQVQRAEPQASALHVWCGLTRRRSPDPAMLAFHFMDCMRASPRTLPARLARCQTAATMPQAAQEMGDSLCAYLAAASGRPTPGSGEQQGNGPVCAPGWAEAADAAATPATGAPAQGRDQGCPVPPLRLGDLKGSACDAGPAPGNGPQLSDQFVQMSARLRTFAGEWVQRLEATEARPPTFAAEAHDVGGSRSQVQPSAQGAEAAWASSAASSGGHEEDVTRFENSPEQHVRAVRGSAARSSGGSTRSSAPASGGASSGGVPPPPAAVLPAPTSGALRDDPCPSPLAADGAGPGAWPREPEGAGLGASPRVEFSHASCLYDDLEDVGQQGRGAWRAPAPAACASPVRSSGPLASGLSRAKRGGPAPPPPPPRPPVGGVPVELRRSTCGLRASIRASANAAAGTAAAVAAAAAAAAASWPAAAAAPQGDEALRVSLTSPLMAGRNSLRSSLQRSAEFKHSGC
jgi:hypothetical protein